VQHHWLLRYGVLARLALGHLHQDEDQQRDDAQKRNAGQQRAHDQGQGILGEPL
jgi:hypothetical protein